MHPDLVKLLELQAKDVALLEADQALDAVLAELEALDQQLADADAELARTRKAVADTTRRRGEVEAKVDNYKKLEARGKARLDQIKNPREAQAVMTELDLARSVLAKEEQDWMKLADQVSGLEAQVTQLEGRLAEMRAAQETQRTEVNGRRQAAEGVRQARLAERDAMANSVNRALRQRYERLRTVKLTRVVMALDGAACSACFTTVPLNRRNQIRAGTLIDACESCGVILFAPEEIE